MCEEYDACRRKRAGGVVVQEETARKLLYGGERGDTCYEEAEFANYESGI